MLEPKSMFDIFGTMPVEIQESEKSSAKSELVVEEKQTVVEPNVQEVPRSNVTDQ